MKAFFIFIGVALAQGCNDSSSGNGATPVTDTEPNDDFASPQALGTIQPGKMFAVSGNGSFMDSATDDEFDSYNLIAMGDQEIRVVLTHPSGDLDLAFVDPMTGEILTDECDLPTSPEMTCVLRVDDGQSVNVEVEAFEGSSDYSMTIESVP